MIIRLGLLVAASIAAYKIQQISVRRWRTPPKSSEMDDASRRQTSDGDDKHHSIHPSHGLKEVVGDEEVKLISGVINQPSSNFTDTEDEILVFESMLSGETNHPLPSEKYDKMKESKAERDTIYKKEMADNATELERLGSLVRGLQEREARLEEELLKYYGLKDQESVMIEFRKQSKMKSKEIDMLKMTINSLQAERKRLQAEAAQGVVARKDLEIARNKIQEMQRQIQIDKNQTKAQLLLLKQKVISLQVKEEEAMTNDSEVEKRIKAIKELEVEVVELKRKNKELQHEKRELAVKLETAEAKIKTLSSMNNLRHAYEDLQKQVEELQMNRFTDVKELVYLRWVNACLRYELGNCPTKEGKISACHLSKRLSPRSQAKAKQMMLEYAGSDSSEQSQCDTDLDRKVSQRSYSFSEYSDNTSIDSSMSKYGSLSKNSSLIQKLRKWGKFKDDSSNLLSPVRSEGGSSMRVRRGPLKALMLMEADETEGGTGLGMIRQDLTDSPEASRIPAEKYPANKNHREPKLAEIEKATSKVPQPPGPPPKLSVGAPTDSQSRPLEKVVGTPPPPPPPINDPVPSPSQAAMTAGGNGEKVHKNSEVLEIYQSPMVPSNSNTLQEKNNHGREISNNSSFYLSVKADEETQGDLARFLPTEIRADSFSKVDEGVDLKHFETDALREVAFEYQDLLNLEKQVTSFADDPSLPCEAALDKMYKLLEKVEQGVTQLLSTRDMAISRYKELGIPVDWLLDPRLIGKIKLSSMKLARDYMKRVASELDSLSGPEKEPTREFLALQGVRFAFRVHQFAGGFDVESMKAFGELRSRLTQ